MQSVKLDLAGLIADPEWLPHRFDAGRREVLFINLTKSGHREASFLADQYVGDRPRVRVPLDALTSAVSGVGDTRHFVFHSAFCCSTLVARALDQPGASFGLKEPFILADMAELHRRRKLEPSTIRVVLHLLSRRFEPGEVIVIKPTNEANDLMPVLLSAEPAGRALLMTSALDDFLYSVAKKGLWGRAWVRRLLASLAPHQRRSAGFTPAELFEHTDLQIAAQLWLLHRAQFVDAHQAAPARLRSLDSADLLADPPAVIGRLASFFGIVSDNQEAAAAVFGQHSKELGRTFDRDERARERQALRAAHAEEVKMVVTWTEHVARHMGVPLTLEHPL